QGGLRGDIHSDCIIRLASSLSEPRDLPELPSHFLNHFVGAVPDGTYRRSREDEREHRPDECAYHDSRLVQSEFCAQGCKLAREERSLPRRYRCKVEELCLVSCHLQHEGLKEEQRREGCGPHRVTLRQRLCRIAERVERVESIPDLGGGSRHLGDTARIINYRTYSVHGEN